MIPIWFLAVYVLIALLVPPTHAAWERWGMGSFWGLVGAAAVVDAAVAAELPLAATVDAAGVVRVLDLGRDQFAIEDEGSPQELVTFARGDIPFTAVLLIERSLSSTGAAVATRT